MNSLLKARVIAYINLLLLLCWCQLTKLTNNGGNQLFIFKIWIINCILKAPVKAYHNLLKLCINLRFLLSL